jgi:hypothetical protein
VQQGNPARPGVAAELDTGRLIALPWTGPPLTLSSCLVAHQQRSISPAHAALRAATRKHWRFEGIGAGQRGVTCRE